MVIIAFFFEWTVFLLSCILLIVASYQDLKARLVDGSIWLLLFILVIPVNLIRLVLYWNNSTLLIYIAISMVIGILLALFMLLFGLWGEADILALICLSLVNPISIKLISGVPNIFNTNFLSFILPVSLTLVMNAALLQIPLPIIILVKNYYGYRKHPERYQIPQSSTLRKIFASCLGEPLPITSILTKPLFFYQMLEKNTLYNNKKNLNEQYPVPFIRLASEPLLRWKENRRNSYSLLHPNMINKQRQNFSQLQFPKNKHNWSFDFSIGLKSEEEDLFRQRTLLNQASKDLNLQRENVWVQYSIPFLIPMFIGFILAFNGINILFQLFTLLHWM